MSSFNRVSIPLAIASLLAGWASFTLVLPAIDHHPFGGNMPSNAIEGFLSGLGHPVIGPDYFVFGIALGLLATTKNRRIFLPIAFVIATLAGISFHLAKGDLPALEAIIAIAVLGLGNVLATDRNWLLAGLIGFGAIAGLCHGYADDEAITSAEMTPLLASLRGVAAI
ncbi:MAG: hydantoin utilization protein A [Leptolyngbya sp. SIO1D8]|nr:hydantoin utilization protein A [Leptolyngbya sp. SIO1D8]